MERKSIRKRQKEERKTPTHKRKKKESFTVCTLYSAHDKGHVKEEEEGGKTNYNTQYDKLARVRV